VSRTLHFAGLLTGALVVDSAGPRRVLLIRVPIRVE